MESEKDFAALRNLLLLRKLEMPIDTEVNRFVIEFHRRQRSQLLAPQSPWARVTAWFGENVAAFRFSPSLSYTASAVALVWMACLALSPETPSAPSQGRSSFALRMPTEASLVPVSFLRDSSPTRAASLTFGPASANASTTRFVLTNSRVAYDATAAF